MEGGFFIGHSVWSGYCIGFDHPDLPIGLCSISVFEMVDLTWLPLIYVFDSSVTSCAIWIGIAWYLSDSRWTDGSYHLGLTLGIILVAAVPYAWKLIKQTPYAWTWHHWLVPLVLIQFLFTLNPPVCNKLTLIHLVILIMIYDSISETLFNGSLTLSHGYKVISFVGLTIMGFMMSFKFLVRNGDYTVA